MTASANTPITLEKDGATSIPRTSGLTAVLKWHGRDGDNSGDLDFYCFYVTTKEKTGKIYYKNRGKEDTDPYIRLLGDSQNPGEETIIIERPEEIKYLLFSAYSAAENGIGSFYSYNAYVIISNNEDKKVIVPLLEKNNQSYWVAIALLDFTVNDSNVQIKQIEKYSAKNCERSPILQADGTVEMDAGDIEFKGFDLKIKK